MNCSHERGVLARREAYALESRVLVSARRLRDLKAAPEDMEIEAIEPVKRGSAGVAGAGAFGNTVRRE